MRHSFSLCVITAFLFIAAPSTYATVIQYTADLSGAAEDPPNVSPGTGSVLVTIDDVAHTMRIEAIFSGLTGTTTAAHIHCCTATAGSGLAGVATTTPSLPGFPSGVTAGSVDVTLDMLMDTSFNGSFLIASGGTAAAAEAALLAGLSSGEAYFNIHTTSFGAGEIRGFLTAVTDEIPEPTPLALLSIGAAGLLLTRRSAA